MSCFARSLQACFDFRLPSPLRDFPTNYPGILDSWPAIELSRNPYKLRFPPRCRLFISLGKSGAKLLCLLRELFRIGFFQPGKIVKLPLDRRQFLKVRTFHQLPVGFAGHQADQKLPLIGGQFGRQIPFELRSHFLQFGQ